MIFPYTSRALAIYHLDLRYMLRPSGKFVFSFYKLHKSWKFGKALPSLEFCESIEDSKPVCGDNLSDCIKRSISGKGRKSAPNYH